MERLFEIFFGLVIIIGSFLASLASCLILEIYDFLKTDTIVKMLLVIFVLIAMWIVIKFTKKIEKGK